MISSDHVICIVQARMGSTRLPGKVLAELSGRPMLELLLDRLALVGSLDGSARPLPVIVATSDQPADDAVEVLCDARSAPVVRGSELDVLDRFATVVERFPCSHVIRITADCPLTDPGVVGDVVRLHLERNADYTSNVFPRTFPKGLDVEVVRSSCLQTARAEARLPEEREHVTPFIYRHPERFALANLRSGADLGDERWTVDTEEDLLSLRSMLGTDIDPVAITWTALLDRVGRRYSGPLRRLRPAEQEDSARLLAWRNDVASVRFSLSGTAVLPVEHEAWIARVLDDPAVELNIIEMDGVPTGMIRVDISDATGFVSLSVDRAHRGRGVGQWALDAVVGRAASGVRLDRLVAAVHRDNGPSSLVFERAGFLPTGTDGAFITWTWTHPRRRRTEVVL